MKHVEMVERARELKLISRRHFDDARKMTESYESKQVPVTEDPSVISRAVQDAIVEQATYLKELVEFGAAIPLTDEVEEAWCLGSTDEWNAWHELMSALQENGILPDCPLCRGLPEKREEVTSKL